MGFVRAGRWRKEGEVVGGGGCEQIMGMAGEVMRGVGGLTHLLGGGGYIGGASMSVRGGAGAWPRRGAHG
jgi:hypothetical protein